MNADTQITCPKCQRRFRTQKGAGPGATVACSHCGALVVVPRPEPEAPAPVRAGGQFADAGQATIGMTPEECPVAAGQASAPPRPAAEEHAEEAAAPVTLSATEALERPPAAAPRSGAAPAEAPAAPDATEVLEHAPRARPAPPSGATVVLPYAPTGDATVGRYIEKGPIGRGGMGEVVLCVDRNVRREIALKRILPRAAEEPESRARFVMEAQVTGQLEHPNIVPVHELDKYPDGTMYFTMKLVKGQSLGQILKSAKERAGWHSLSDLLQIFLKVCDGVGFAHSRGVIHRDLKPANIMVGEYGEVLVMDWGIAKLVGHPATSSGIFSTTSTQLRTGVVDGPFASDLLAAGGERSDAGQGAASGRADRPESLTAQGTTLGSPGYMAPEQADGNLGEIDQRSDIYSLGGILYEILTLERPVEGETTLALLANTLKGRIIPPERRAPGRPVPRELSAVTMRCLALNRADRYPSVAHLKRDIGIFLEGRSNATGAGGAAQAKGKSKALTAVVAALAIALIGVGGFLAIWFKGQCDAARSAEQQARAEATEAQEKQKALLAASETQAQQAIRAMEEGRLQEAQLLAGAVASLVDESPWGHYALGVLAFERGELDKAETHARAALDRHQGHWPSRALLDRIRARRNAPAK